MSEPLFETRSLSKHFGGLKALEAVDLVVERGEIHSVIGPNGAGKTTLFNCVTGIYPPTEGRVLFEGRGITGLPARRVTKRGLARTFQNIRLFKEMSARENVMVGRHVRARAGWFRTIFRTPGFRREERAIAEQALEKLEFVGLSAMAETGAANLPYGHQRRLEIARALATDPKLLLLDEPAAGMNPEETRRLMELICRVRDEGITVLLIEHDMKVVMGISDRITVIDHGERIADGTPGKIRNDARVIEAYLGVPEEAET
jgi:branched-chain amino acid transport system ATP-binding protein